MKRWVLCEWLISFNLHITELNPFTWKLISCYSYIDNSLIMSIQGITSNITHIIIWWHISLEMETCWVIEKIDMYFCTIYITQHTRYPTQLKDSFFLKWWNICENTFYYMLHIIDISLCDNTNQSNQVILKIYDEYSVPNITNMLHQKCCKKRLWCYFNDRCHVKYKSL